MRRYAIHRKTSNPLLAELVDRRRQMQMTRVELAKRLRRCPTHVHRWEVGKSEPSLRNLENWCDVLGLTLKIETKPSIMFPVKPEGQND